MAADTAEIINIVHNIESSELKNLGIHFEKETANFKWKQFLADALVKETEEIVVYQPSYFQALGKLLKQESIDTWKTYFTYYLLSDNASRCDRRQQTPNIHKRALQILSRKTLAPSIFPAQTRRPGPAHRSS